MTRPLVSVLIPCYNAAKYIGEALESVFRQTWQNIEVIVIDDGSEDDSVREIERFRNENLSLVRQRNAGAAAARNRAYGESCGEFIQFLDADDILDARKIETQMTRLIGERDCVASAEWDRFYQSPPEAGFQTAAASCDMAPVDRLAIAWAEGLPMLFPALWLFPRAIAERAGPWNETLSLGDDGEYFTRALLQSRKVLFCAGSRCWYRSGDAHSLSARKTDEAWMSSYRVLELCESHLIACEDSERIRRGFALSWQHMAHACYPYNSELAERALARARTLHAVTIRPDGGLAFRLASRVAGWRTARRLQVATGRP